MTLLNQCQCERANVLSNTSTQTSPPSQFTVISMSVSTVLFSVLVAPQRPYQTWTLASLQSVEGEWILCLRLRFSVTLVSVTDSRRPIHRLIRDILQENLPFVSTSHCPSHGMYLYPSSYAGTDVLNKTISDWRMVNPAHQGALCPTDSRNIL